MILLSKMIDGFRKTLNKLLNSMIGTWALKITFASNY